jgi:hypothetical protein
MFAALFVKKKISQKQLAYNFVHHTLNSIDQTYSDFLDAIYNDPELENHPKLNYSNPEELMFIIISGNIKFFERILSAHEEKILIDSIIDQMASVFQTDFHLMEEKINKYTSFISRVNHPSKNILYGMSKAVFFKFKLGQYQDDYFAQLNTPNPIFLKKIDTLIENYIWDWKTVFEKIKIST